MAMHRNQESVPGGWRVALYSHDAMGIGHVRRNLLIAHALVSADVATTVLLLCGAHEAGAFDMPPGGDSRALPALKKQDNSRYGPRRLRLAAEQMVALRAETIAAALKTFDPHV